MHPCSRDRPVPEERVDRLSLSQLGVEGSEGGVKLSVLGLDWDHFWARVSAAHETAIRQPVVVGLVLSGR